MEMSGMSGMSGWSKNSVEKKNCPQGNVEEGIIYTSVFADAFFDRGLAVAYYNRGIARANKGDYDGAIADYTKAIELNPEYADAYYNLGVAKYNKGDTDGSIADYDKTIELTPKYTAAYNNRGAAKYNKGDYDGAIADYNIAIELDPEHAAAYHAKKTVVQMKSEREKKDVEGKEVFSCKVEEIINWKAMNERTPEFAEKYCNQGIAKTYFRRGFAKARLGQLEEATADYEKAINLDPKHVEAYWNIGIAKATLGHYPEARKNWIEAFKINPRATAEAYLNLTISGSGKKRDD